MKQKNNFFRTLFVLTAFLITTSVRGGNDLFADDLDSIEVSLLTCSPHEEVYSLYGHSALRWHDLRLGGRDIAYNWGIFNFDKPFFILRFVFGLTDYELGPIPYGYFCSYYAKWGSSVTEQVLNLTNEEKRALAVALDENLQPGNRIYRYNFFYDNCSTRPRDIIERCINGTVEYVQRKDFTPSYREMVRICTRNHPWAMFGNDILLGIKADFKTTLREQEFLPENLLYDFDHARISSGNASRPLVKEHRVAVKPGIQIIEEDFPLTPYECAWILFFVSIVIWLTEWRLCKTLVWWDVTLMLFQGLAGGVLFVMIFSQHPTTSINLQILLLNPVPLFFIPSVIRKRKTKWQMILFTMIALFAIGSLLQQYAEGMMVVALSLLTRVLKLNRTKH